MTRSAKVNAIRAAAAADRAARGLPQAPVSEEEQLARALKAVPDGLTLTELRSVLHCGRERREEAVAAIRRARWVHEAQESRPNAAGRMQRQVVLRALVDEAPRVRSVSGMEIGRVERG